MFKTIQYIKYFKSENDIHYYLIKIIDDDFKEEYIGISTVSLLAARADAVIKCYYSKNLNVAKNLVLFMQDYQLNQNHHIINQILWYQEYTSGFKQYLPEINKYLNLL